MIDRPTRRGALGLAGRFAAAGGFALLAGRAPARAQSADAALKSLIDGPQRSAKMHPVIAAPGEGSVPGIVASAGRFAVVAAVPSTGSRRGIERSSPTV